MSSDLPETEKLRVNRLLYRYRGGSVSTSSIFTNIKIETQQEAKAFVAALEAAEKAPQISRETPNMRYVTNPNEIRRALEKRKAP